MDVTPESLLVRLCGPPQKNGGTDQAAWIRFVNLYSPLLYRWAIRLEPQENDALDLMQEVFLLLHQKLPEFLYDPQRSFRNWLQTVLYNKWRERYRLRAPPTPVDPSVLNTVKMADSGDTVADEEYSRYLVHRALELMRTDFEPNTWKAFWEMTVNQRSAADVAQELNLSLAAVYKATSRVRKALRQELAGLMA